MKESSLLRRSFPASTVVAAVGLLLVGIGILDLATPGDVRVSFFYVLPVSVATWWIGRRAGLLTAALAAADFLAAYLLEHQSAAPRLVPIWNSLLEFSSFACVAVILWEVRRTQDHLEALAATDSLTGLANRRSFFDRLEDEAARARRSGRPLTLALVDLDGFKEVNDALGHNAGDRVLVEVAALLKDSTRSTDFAARLGGDEFVLLLPDTPEEGALALLEKLRHQAPSRDRPVTLSFGAATFEVPPLRAVEMLARADRLLYAAKEAGRDTLRHETVRGEPDAAPER
jgi:diguanylate cyclase (GGDEF)-like protein